MEESVRPGRSLFRVVHALQTTSRVDRKLAHLSSMCSVVKTSQSTFDYSPEAVVAHRTTSACLALCSILKTKRPDQV